MTGLPADERPQAAPVARYGWPGFSRMNLWRQDKGQDECARAFVEAVRTGEPAPIPLDELLEVARATIAVTKSAQA